LLPTQMPRPSPRKSKIPRTKEPTSPIAAIFWFFGSSLFGSFFSSSRVYLRVGAACPSGSSIMRMGAVQSATALAIGIGLATSALVVGQESGQKKEAHQRFAGRIRDLDATEFLTRETAMLQLLEA